MPKALPDTAATAHYLHPDALPHFSHIARTTSVPTVQVANGNIIKPNLQATLKMSNKLSSKAQSAHVFNSTTTGYLISMGQLFDDDCIAIFTKFDVKILKHNQLIITDLRDHINGLWNIPLEPNPPAQQSSKRSYPNQANGIICHDTTKHKLSQYFHASAFSTVNSTFIAAINKGHFMSCPGLSASLISKYLPQYSFTVKGHLNQEQNNLRSAQSNKDFLNDIHPKKEQRSHNILSAIMNTNSKTVKSYSNQT